MTMSLGDADVYLLILQDGASEHWSVAEYFSDDAFSESTTDDVLR